MCRWSRSGQRSRPLPCNMWRFAYSSPTGFALSRLDPRFAAIGLGREVALYPRRGLSLIPEPFRFCEEECEELQMAVDGNWNIIMSTPMGDRNTTLSLKNSGGALTG